MRLNKMKYQNNAALWTNKTKKGDTYYSFRAERDIKKGEKLNFFANSRKKEDRHPDFTSYEKVEEESTPVTQSINIEHIPF